MMVFTEKRILGLLFGGLVTNFRNHVNFQRFFFLNQASEASSTCMGPVGLDIQCLLGPRWAPKPIEKQMERNNPEKTCPKVNSFHWGEQNTLVIGVISLHQTIYIYIYVYILSIYNYII